MQSRSAITKLKAVFIINLLIVLSTVGAYVYLQNQGLIAPASKPAEFSIADLTINPDEADVGEPVLISVNVSNIGDEADIYPVNLTVNGVLKQNQSMVLLGNESKTVEFIHSEMVEGDYTVDVNGLLGALKIKDAPPETSSITLSNIRVEPYEAWAEEPVNVTVTAHNPTSRADSISVKVSVDGVLLTVKRLELAGGGSQTLPFTVNATQEGRHTVQVNTQSGVFIIVPTGYHTLTVQRSGGGSGVVTATINGQPSPVPYSTLLPVGEYTVSIPTLFETSKAVFRFDSWSDGVTSTTRNINLQGRTLLLAEYSLISGVASCPSLFVWNGSSYVYRTEVSSGTGYLGIFDYFTEQGRLVFLYSDPWDYIKLDNTQITPKDGYYDFTFTQLWDEIFYIDQVKLIAVDHASNRDVFSTKGTYLYDLDNLGTIYTVSKNPAVPLAAYSVGVNGEITNVSSQISALDGFYTSGNEFQWDTLELNLGDLSSAQEIKLLVAGVISYSSGEVQGQWASQFWDKPGIRPFPPPYMEIKVGEQWVPVPDNKQFPLLLVTPESFVVDLTGLFPQDTTEYMVRIHTWFDSRFDYIGVDTTSQATIKTQTLNPAKADLSQVLVSELVTSTGSFTRYGDVTALLLEADDMSVIGRKGDNVHVKVSIDELEPVPEGMERDYFVVVSCWFKVPGLPYLPFTTDPLPFHVMTNFPYPDTEGYPLTQEYLNYLAQYNTRVITNP